VTGCINEIEFVEGVIGGFVIHADGMRLDGNASFTFEIHAVEYLVLHLPAGEGVGLLKQAVGQGGFAVVDVRDDGEITNVFKIHIFGLCQENASVKNSMM
jgi:hypothetical protein